MTIYKVNCRQTAVQMPSASTFEQWRWSHTSTAKVHCLAPWSTVRDSGRSCEACPKPGSQIEDKELVDSMDVGCWTRYFTLASSCSILQQSKENRQVPLALVLSRACFTAGARLASSVCCQLLPLPFERLPSAAKIRVVGYLMPDIVIIMPGSMKSLWITNNHNNKGKS